MDSTSTRPTRRSVLAAAVLGVVASLAVASVASAQLPPGDWKLKYADEFDGASLDTMKWSTGYPWGNIHNHDAYMSPDQVRVGNGSLSLVAEKKRDPAAPYGVWADGAYHVLDYTSGAVNTQGKLNFTYGYVESRMKMGGTIGSWPAFWMLQDGWPPEIDIMEFPVMDHDQANNDLYRYYTNYHWGTTANHQSNGKWNWQGGDLSAAYHNYGLKWEANKLTYYLDGNVVHSVSGAGVGQAAGEYLILNNAVGGWAGTPTSWPGGGDSFDIDWVRVWQEGGNRVQTHWNVNGDGWLDTAANWTNGVPDLQGKWAWFDTKVAANITVDWFASKTVSDVVFDSNTNYTLGRAGDDGLMFVKYSNEANAWLTVDAGYTGRHTINARLELRDDTNFANFSAQPLTINGGLVGRGRFMTRASGGEIVLNGQSSLATSTVIDGSPVTVGGKLYAGAVNADATVSVTNGGTLKLANLDGGANLGNLPAQSGRLLLDNGTLRLTGRSNTTRGFTVGAGGATILADGGSDVLLHDAGGASTYIASNSGGTLTLGGAGDARLAKRLGGTGGLTKAGTGSWTVSSADNSYAGPTRVQGGTLTVAAGAKLGNGGAVDVSGGTLSLAKLGPARGNDQVVGALSVGANGRLDVGNSRVFSTGGNFADLQAAVNAGRVTQSGTVANRTVGVYNGGTTTVVGYAAHGDGDLDGAVTISDINRLVADGFRGAPKAATTWQTGDWDHDGATTISDVNLVVAEGLLNTGLYDTTGTAGGAGGAGGAGLVFAGVVGSGDGVPDLIIDVATGRATLDTDGQTLTAFQIQSRGANATITLAGDGDGLLLAGKTAPGQFFFTNSSRDEFAGSLGTLAAGVYDLGQLFDPSLTNLPLSNAAALGDLRFGFNGDASAAGNGNVTFVPEPSGLALAGVAAAMVLRRRRA